METRDTVVEFAPRVRELERMQPFCADQLPDWLAKYTGELAIRYTVPQSDLALACIATAGTIVGPRAKAEIGWGARATASNLLVVISPRKSSNLEQAVQHIVAPVVNRQNEMLRLNSELNASKVKKDLELHLEQAQTARPDAQARREHLTEIAKLRRFSKPALLVGELDRETLLRTLSQSVDGTLFLCNELARQQDPYHMEKCGPLDNDLIHRCLNRSPIIESLKQGTVRIPEPALGGVLVATTFSLPSWFAQFGRSSALGSSLLLLESPAKPADINSAALDVVSLQNEWHSRIESLMGVWNPEAIPLRLSRKARVILFDFHNQVVGLTAGLLQPAQEIFASPYQLATRLMIGLHLLGRPDLQISDETAAAAVMLARHYGPRQLCAWKDIYDPMPEALSRLVHLEVA
jgi:hypothetical protein